MELQQEAQEMAQANQDQILLIEMTSDIVSSYVAHNPVSTSELPSLVTQVHKTLSDLSRGENGVGKSAMNLNPAVPVKKSITDDYIICLEDGKKFKSLKRHLSSHYGLSPEAYREKWGLPSDYPMVAPNYAKKRSALAKQIGLGRRGGEADTSQEAA